jgi:hypothetical protein
MVDQRVYALETLGREELLGVEASVRAPKLNVALMRNAAFSEIRRHLRSARLYRRCSFGCRESIVAVRTVAERFGLRAATTAEGDVWALDGVRISLTVGECNRPAYEIRAALADLNDNFVH